MLMVLSISLLRVFKCVVMNHASFIDRLQTSEEASFECLTSVEIESIFYHILFQGFVSKTYVKMWMYDN